MKKAIIIIALFISATTVSFAQAVYEIRQAMDFYQTNKMLQREWNNTLTEKDIDGSPYLTDDFVTGVVYTTTKQKYVDLPLRYNIYNDQMEFKTAQGEIQAMAVPEIVEFVEYGDFKMVYTPFSISKKVRHGFFKVETEGKASLYSRSEVEFRKAEEPGAYKEAVPPKFIRKPDTYYIKVGTAQAIKVGNKKDLIELFPDHKDEISSYIKKNKIKAGKLESLDELVTYYNSL